MSEKCRHDKNKHKNNNSDNPLTSRRTDGGKKNLAFFCSYKLENSTSSCTITEV